MIMIVTFICCIMLMALSLLQPTMATPILVLHRPPNIDFFILSVPDLNEVHNTLA
jgi:hypothetical protein